MGDAQSRGPTAPSQSSGQVQEKVQDLKEQAGEQVQKVTGRAQEQVQGRVDEKSTQIGEQISSGADTLRKVADQLRSEDNGQPAKYAEQAADKAHELADYLKRSDGQTILRDLESFGRKQPWVVVLGGLTLGFVASRFLKASSSDRYQSSQGSGGSSIYQSGIETYSPALPSSTGGDAVTAGSVGSVTSGLADTTPEPTAPGAVTGTTATGGSSTSTSL